MKINPVVHNIDVACNLFALELSNGSLTYVNLILIKAVANTNIILRLATSNVENTANII